MKIRWISLTLLAAIVLVVGYYGYSVMQFAMNISKPATDYTNVDKPSEEQEEAVYQVPEWEGKERVNILILGGDGRDEKDPGRSDTILLLSIEPVKKQLHLFSILRDTYVDIPDHGKNKINAALAFGGPSLAMKTASDLVGLPVHYYVFINLDSFIDLVDMIGGVDLYVEKNMKYYDPTDKPEYQINLKEGMQHLDGNKALQYVRFRKDALSDYSRTERQRKFLMAVAEKMQTTSTLIALPNILEQMAPHIHTNMEVDKMLKLAVLGYKIPKESIVSAQLPPMDLLKENTIKGASVIQVDGEQLKKYVEQLLE
ncbi:LCP family protein [Brevibacillus ruminantium]|uniref:LCP family protein n=1 Tax=Brevibacillus ruminantium TaxID=2950604 RepID=A0ABY4WIL7_9BACL|nr:LCP family protein [Brevibacillus ruminantium]USG65665.1 LCP family protein [Brevibacillus ruminantium]